MKIINFLAASLILGSLASSFAVTPTLAGDGKAYPGSLCVPWGDNRDPEYFASAIGNRSTTDWLYLDCPAVKDQIGEVVVDGWVRMIDHNYDDDIYCTLVHAVYDVNKWLEKRYGDKTEHGRRTSSSGSSTSIQHKYFPAEPLPSFGVGVIHYGVSLSDESHVYFSCAIPPTYQGKVSYITSYYVEEDE